MSMKQSFDEVLTDQDKAAPKTKIVVHINNYIIDTEEETSHDLTGQLRSLASPDSFFLENGSHYGSQYNCDVDISRLKKVIQPSTTTHKSNDTYIVHAKSMKFPVKIRPSYEIYPTSNVRDDIKSSSFLNTTKSFNSKFDINFQLPFISPSHQTNFQNYQARHLQNTNIKPTAKVSLPSYLNPNAVNKAQSFSLNRNSKSNPMLTYKKIVKLRESNSNENIADKQRDLRRPLESERQKNLITLGQNFERAMDHSLEHSTESFNSNSNNSSDKKGVEGAHSQKNFRYIHRKKDGPLMKPINYSFKLPPFLTSKYATTNRTYQEFSVDLINQEISSKFNLEERNRMSFLSNQMDDEINKIIKNYPSIVVRRKTVKRY